MKLEQNYYLLFNNRLSHESNDLLTVKSIRSRLRDSVTFPTNQSYFIRSTRI